MRFPDARQTVHDRAGMASLCWCVVGASSRRRVADVLMRVRGLLLFGEDAMTFQLQMETPNPLLHFAITRGARSYIWQPFIVVKHTPETVQAKQ